MSNEPQPNEEVTPTKKMKRKKKAAKARVPDRALPFAVDMPEFKTRYNKIRMVRLPPAVLLDEEPEDAGFCQSHWRKVVAMSALLALVVGGYFLFTGNGPLSQMIRGFVEQSVEVFGFKVVPANDTDAFGWEYMDVTQARTWPAITEPSDFTEEPTRAPKPVTQRAPPADVQPTAQTTFGGNDYYFYHNPYKQENAMKICYERHNKSRLLYIADKDESDKIVEWYYNEIYDEIMLPNEEPIRMIWTAGIMDYRNDYRTAKPLPETSIDDLKKSDRWKWLGVDGSVVSMQNTTSALCFDWKPNGLEKTWDQLKDKAKEILLLYGTMKMHRTSREDIEAGCFTWLLFPNKEFRDSWAMPFICKKMSDGNFPNDDAYKKNYIKSSWVVDE